MSSATSSSSDSSTPCSSQQPPPKTPAESSGSHPPSTTTSALPSNTTGSPIPTYERSKTLGSCTRKANSPPSSSYTLCRESWAIRTESSFSLWTPETSNRTYRDTIKVSSSALWYTLPSSATPFASHLSIHSTVSCYGPLNLVPSPNSTPPPNPLPCNTREGTSAHGRGSANPTREPKTKRSKRKYGITATKPSSPGWRDLSLRPCDTFHAYKPLPSPHCLPLYTSCIIVSLVVSLCSSVRFTLFSSTSIYYHLNDTSPSLPAHRLTRRAISSYRSPHIQAVPPRRLIIHVHSRRSAPHNQNTKVQRAINDHAHSRSTVRGTLKLSPDLRGRESRIHETGGVGTVVVGTD
jgi:hypothetical protein